MFKIFQYIYIYIHIIIVFFEKIFYLLFYVQLFKFYNHIFFLASCVDYRKLNKHMKSSHFLYIKSPWLRICYSKTWP